jgi:hypothetical protein
MYLDIHALLRFKQVFIHIAIALDDGMVWFYGA